MRTMYDSVTIADLPQHTQMAMGYIDGSVTRNNFSLLIQRFPNIKTVKCTVLGDIRAQVADIEAGDLTPAHGAEWAKKRLASLHTPTVYFSLANLDYVREELDKRHVLHQTLLFVAHYDGVAELPHGYIAKQYAAPQHGSPGHYDISVVADHWPGVDRPPHHPNG